MIKKVSWICTTYRREEMLPDVIRAFLSQDWDGEKELIILNDEITQELTCDHPEIRCINWVRKIGTLGGKSNIACSLATGDLLIPTDDDDWYGPSRISDAVENMAGGFYKCSSFLIDTEPVEIVGGRIHCNYAFTKEALIHAGAYNIGNTRQIDIRLLNSIDYQMKSMGLQCRQPITPSYLYRKFGSGNTHYSDGFGLERKSGFRTGRIDLVPSDVDKWSTLDPVDNGRMFCEIHGSGAHSSSKDFWDGIKNDTQSRL